MFLHLLNTLPHDFRFPKDPCTGKDVHAESPDIVDHENEHNPYQDQDSQKRQRYHFFVAVFYLVGKETIMNEILLDLRMKSRHHHRFLCIPAHSPFEIIYAAQASASTEAQNHALSKIV